MTLSFTQEHKDIIKQILQEEKEPYLITKIFIHFSELIPDTFSYLLKKFVSLETLSIFYVDLNSISFLSNLPNLSTVRIIKCNLTDITIFSTVQNLLTLELQHNNISDISPLCGKQYEFLYIYDNPILNVDMLDFVISPYATNLWCLDN